MDRMWFDSELTHCRKWSLVRKRFNLELIHCSYCVHSSFVFLWHGPLRLVLCSKSKVLDCRAKTNIVFLQLFMSCTAVYFREAGLHKRRKSNTFRQYRVPDSCLALLAFLFFWFESGKTAVKSAQCLGALRKKYINAGGKKIWKRRNCRWIGPCWSWRWVRKPCCPFLLMKRCGRWHATAMHEK